MPLIEKSKEGMGQSCLMFGNSIIVGLGGAGCNFLDRFYKTEMNRDVCSVAIHTDGERLSRVSAHRKVLIGNGIKTNGIPEIGKQAGEESAFDIEMMLQGVRVVFLVCGVGGGTGTGVSQVITRIAKQKGLFTVVMAYLPFRFEG